MNFAIYCIIHDFFTAVLALDIRRLKSNFYSCYLNEFNTLLNCLAALFDEFPEFIMSADPITILAKPKPIIPPLYGFGMVSLSAKPVTATAVPRTVGTKPSLICILTYTPFLFFGGNIILKN